ncbi:MAG: HlyD family efflux transporter periplasmic adaptor subunit [Lachnospiraceae bacterium]|nr:HlyD family efflux transporter periplasmic adaptor subunit [Lachnospiraceae bacterium]
MKKHKKLIIIIVVIALVVGLGIWATSCAKRASNLLSNMSNSAKTAEVEQRDIVNSVSASGTITSLSTRILTTSFVGTTVDKVNVSLGDKVLKDDIICILDDSNLAEKLDDAEYSKSTSSKLTNIERGSASRALDNAVETQQIENGRANDRVNKAQEKVDKYQGKVDEAYSKYAEAHADTAKVYEKMQVLNAQAQEIYKSIEANRSERKGIDSNFSSTAKSLLNLLHDLKAKGIEVDSSVIETVSIGYKENITTKSIYSGNDEEIKNSIKEFVHSLNDYNNTYNDKFSEYEKIKENKTATEAELQKLNAEYEGLLKAETLLKDAYEAQNDVLSPYKDALEQTIQARDDTARSTEQNVLARKDALASTNINADSSKRNMESSIEKVEEQIDDCTIKSPIDGIITSISVTEGEACSSGAIVTIEDTSSYEVTAYIDEYDIPKIKVGQKVSIKTNGTGDTKLEGVVKTVSPRAERGLQAVQYKVVISVLSANDDIRLDMTAKLEIVIEEKKNALCVPFDAIQVDEKGNFFVEVLDSGAPIDFSALTAGNGPISSDELKKYQNADTSYESHRVIVTKGLESDYYIEIFSDELKAGTTIVIPSNGLFSNIGLYMEETGATGGF